MSPVELLLRCQFTSAFAAAAQTAMVNSRIVSVPEIALPMNDSDFVFLLFLICDLPKSEIANMLDPVMLLNVPIRNITRFIRKLLLFSC